MATTYISPTGAGNKSGSSWANAAAISGLDAAIKKAGAGGTVLLAADKGDYKLSSIINITTGGVTIKGINTDGTAADAHFVGTRAPNWTLGQANGNELFRIQKGADNLTFSDLKIDNTATAFRVGGDVKNLTIHDVDANNVQRFFEDYITGTNKTATISGLTIKDVNVEGFSKGVIRLQYDTNNVVIKDVVGDSLRQEGDNFAIGVHLEDTVHNVLLERVTMDNATDDKGVGVYWNGDGFAAERDTYNLTFIDTVARGNTDGGYDIKASHVTLTGAIAEDNGKNFRFWGQDIKVTDAVGLNPEYRGGSSSQAQVWVARGADVTITNSTFADSGSKTTVFAVETGASLHLSDDEVTYAGNLGLSKSAALTVDATKVAATGLNSQGATFSDGTAAIDYVRQTATLAAPTQIGVETASDDLVRVAGTSGNDVVFGTSKSELFLVDQSTKTGADTIKGFGPTDFIAFTQQLGDSDGDGLTGFGKDGILQLSNGGTLVVEGLVKDLRLIGETADGYVYGDSAVWRAGSSLPTGGKASAEYSSTKANETFIGTNARETFYFDINAGPHGKDTIRGFGATDVIATKVALYDGNGDGLIAPGKNGLDLGDKVSVISLPELSRAGLRALGHDIDGYIYADAAVSPKGALEGKLVVSDTLSGGKSDTATDKFFFDTALDRQLGADKVVNFGAKDVIVSTTLLGSDVSGSKINASDGVFGLHHGTVDLGSFSVTDIGGAAIGALEYDGVQTVAGINYYVYSSVGSAIGIDAIG